MARGYHSGPDGGVGNITVLQNQPNAGRALELLYKIHSVSSRLMSPPFRSWEGPPPHLG